MKSPRRLTRLFYFIADIKMKSLATITMLLYFTAIKMKLLTTLTTVFHFVTIIKMKSLFILTMLFYFTTIKIQ